MEAPKHLNHDFVLLSRKNMSTSRLRRKLDYKQYKLREITEVIINTAVYFKISMEYIIHKFFHISHLELVIQESPEVNLEIVLDAADPMEADDKFHIEEVMDSLEKNCKFTYLVHWRGFSANKD
jgi:SOS response regulatory protein OraA/RecX